MFAELDFLDSVPIRGALAAHNSSSALVIRVMCGWPDGGLMMVLWASEVDITCAELEFWLEAFLHAANPQGLEVAQSLPQLSTIAATHPTNNS